jgi:TRAP-type C4-dicarboxylate transport system substrate-binding protein
MLTLKSKIKNTFTGGSIAVALACTVGPNPVLAQDSHILAHIMPTDHLFHKVSEQFMEDLETVSSGKMKIEYHPGGDLGDWGTITEQVMRGAIPMTMTWANSELDPRLDVANLGYVADSWSSARELYGPGSKMEALFNDIYSDLGMVLLGTVPTDFTGFVVRKGLDVPVDITKDSKGFKMRVPNFPMAINRYEALGFSVVPMAFSEVHMALQTGGIDGRSYSPPSEVLMFADVLEAYVFTRESFETTFWLANKKWFNNLSADEKAWVKESASSATNWAWDNAEKDSTGWFDKIREAGIDVVELTPKQLKEYKQRVISAEWPIMENLLGKKVMEGLATDSLL